MDEIPKVLFFGDCIRGQKKELAAVSAYQRAVGQDSNFFEASYNLGLMLRTKGEHKIPSEMFS